MPLLTTTLGSYPKPSYVTIPDWFRARRTTLPDHVEAYNDYLRSATKDTVEILDRGTVEIVKEQSDLGIDIPTDGEVRRENYVNYHCRHLVGFDFEDLTEQSMRDGAWMAYVPTVRGPIEVKYRFLVRDWRIAQAATKRLVKMTIPGPFTITGSTADAYYGDRKQWGIALAEAINVEVKALAEAGCQYIQIDEPVFAREPELALAYGIDNLERCFHGVPSAIVRTSHICCGYPDMVDNEDYLKADQQAYFRIAEALDYSSLDAISLEDAHRHNDLSLLEKFSQTQVIFGVIAIARSRVESVDEIVERLTAALDHIDAERLIVAPDCGLAMLDRRLVVEKLRNMVAAAQAVG